MKLVRVEDSPVISTPLSPFTESDYACIAYCNGMGGVANSENFLPDLTIWKQTGGFTVPGPGEIRTPVEGMWVWDMHFYWSDFPTLSGGTDGVSYGGWSTEVSSDGAVYTDSLSLTPFTKDGASPCGYRYHRTSGLISTMSGSPPMAIYMSGGPQFYGYASVSGNSFWDVAFTVARVSALTEDYVCAM